jgi:hypothetical protein
MKSKVRTSLGVFVSLFFLWVACDTESNVDPVYKDHFIKYYGEDGNQEGKDLLVNSDGTLIILGTSTTPGGSKRMYIAKTDLEGKIIWERKLGSTVKDEVAVDIELINGGPDAGNYIILSNVTKSISDSLAIRLTIISPGGDSLKSATINRYESQVGKSITSVSDGSYFIAGKVLNVDTLNVSGGFPPSLFDIEDVLIIKVPNTLVPAPTDYSRVGGSTHGAAIKVFEATPPNFYYGGYCDELVSEAGAASNYELNFTFRRFTFDPASTTTVYSGNNVSNEEMTAIARSSSGSSYLSIGTITETNGEKTMIAASANANFTNAGSMQNLLSNAEGVSVAPAGQVGFLLVGNVDRGGGNRDIWLRKVNSDSDLDGDFTTTFGGLNNDDRAGAVAELLNGDILVLGTMNLVNQDKIVLIKLKANGEF